MNEQERAEQHLRTIRRLMERATIYRAISAPTALVGGLLSTAASALWIFCPNLDWHRPYAFLFLWLLVLMLTAGSNALFIILGARRRNEPVLSASMKTALLALAPPFFIAAILTVTIGIASLDPMVYMVLSIIWVVFYGLGLLATAHFAPRSIAFLGWAFLISGAAALIAVGSDSGIPFRAIVTRDSMPFMALTFGLYHLIYAACVWPRKGAAPEP